ncbi:MAG: RNA polymerase sigma factor [Phycisphaerae bacterium]
MDFIRDAELVTKVCGGQRELFRELIESYQNKIYAIAYCRLGDRHLAEEAVQEAFVNAYTKLRTLRKPELFGPWLCTITRRVVLSTMRKRWSSRPKHQNLESVKDELSSKVISADEQANSREVSDILRETLGQLPKDLAETITLFYIQENSVTETSRLLGISEQAVKTRLYRGRQLLRQPLEKILCEELGKLKPSSNLVPAVLAALPSMPWKTGFLTVLSPFWGLYCLIQIGLMSFWMVIFSYLFRKSFKDSKDYRLTYHNKRFLKMIPLMILTILISSFVAFLFKSAPRINFLLGFFFIFISALQLPSNLRTWRVNNRHPLLGTMIILLMGIMYWILLAASSPIKLMQLPMIGFAFIILLQMRTKNIRQDHNLFLRAIKGELPLMNESIDIKAGDLKTFSKLLGGELLITGADFLPDGSCEFDLAPIRHHILMRNQSLFSRVCVDPAGHATSLLSPLDLADLEEFEKRKLSTAEIEDLEQKVAKTVSSTYSLFSKGKMLEARSCLTTITDDAVFSNKDFRKTPYAIFAYAVALLMIVALFWSLLEHYKIL